MWERPINSLGNRIVGTEVELANGSLVWALLGQHNHQRHSADAALLDGLGVSPG